MKGKFYITTTLPYVNSRPHIGFALEIIQADVIARHQSLLGNEVFFNFGTDEHGQKIYQKALEEKKDPQKYVDEYAKEFKKLKDVLNLSSNNFIRTTDPHHQKAAQELWMRCMRNGFIEKGIYKAKYCVGCEMEKQDSEIKNGFCPIHPNLKIQLIEEENYFFRFSKFKDRLLDLYRKYPDFVIPKHRLREIATFVSSGLEDFSVSRLKEKMPWGIPVPNDDKHVMYVWFDALTNYISALGWPENHKKFRDFWGTTNHPKAIQMAGKDNLRQQAAMWQAILMAAELPTSRKIFIHGFITSGGQKISKSLGNVIDPFEYAQKYGADALRYYLLAKVSPTKDSDFTRENFERVYQSDLANGLGNLISRVAKLAEKPDLQFEEDRQQYHTSSKQFQNYIQNFQFDKALKNIWTDIANTDQYINQREPWRLTGSKFEKVIKEVVNQIRQIGTKLEPFLPETSSKIKEQFRGPKIKMRRPLFPRIVKE
jgi:methionyl-tRNA synthetase